MMRMTEGGGEGETVVRRGKGPVLVVVAVVVEVVVGLGWVITRVTRAQIILPQLPPKGRGKCKGSRCIMRKIMD